MAERYNDLEKRQAKKDGATVIKNSGRGEVKGDAKTDSLLIDYKFCAGKSYSLGIEGFTKHYKDATRQDKQGVLVAVFRSYQDRAIAMVDWDYLQQLEIIKKEFEAEYGPLGEGYFK